MPRFNGKNVQICEPRDTVQQLTHQEEKYINKKYVLTLWKDLFIYYVYVIHTYKYTHGELHLNKDIFSLIEKHTI